MGISALVLTYNDEQRIERCLRGVAFADELIVVDSFSTDRTVEIARRFGAVVSAREFTGFSDQWNAAIAQATQDWILIVGSDEVVPDELAAEIKEAVRSSHYAGYSMPRLTYFLGRPIRHCGWYPDYQLRLARRSVSRIPNRLVHETLEVEGKVGRLKNALMHYSFPTIESFCIKMVRYAKAAAQQKMVEGRRFRLADIVFTPGLTFLKMYVSKLGFLDGFRGLLVCALSSVSVLLRYATLWELSARARKEIKDDV
jgi:glycosyltransferase involved in cell wall biosynthesis